MGEEHHTKQINRKIEGIYMEKEILPQPDKNGITRVLPSELSEVNRQRLKQFGAFVFCMTLRTIILYAAVFIRPTRDDTRKY